ncbi:hypothetical protein HJG60_007892 [Phyllostomus discolor]|uniref:Uncharacterized protein n=1 Tax=Phyllostomus discolor TaxID=89673 RepID=A0A834BKU3_9CHIR|nr:hypothetical protein HJG60_007892 [Phyllostomus discolor]
MRRGGSRARLGGGRQEGAEPRLQAAAARSYRSPPHHLPPRCRLPAQPPAASGAVLKNQRNRARGLWWRIPPDTLQPGRLQRGKRGRRGACAAVATKPIAPTRADEEQPLPGSRARRSSLRARRTAASPPLAGAQQQLRGPAPHLPTPARGESRGGRRKRSRRPLLPPPPPRLLLPEPGAPAGGGEVVPGDFSRPLASPEGQSDHGVGLPSRVPGDRERVGSRTKSCGLGANHCNLKSCAA